MSQFSLGFWLAGVKFLHQSVVSWVGFFSLGDIKFFPFRGQTHILHLSPALCCWFRGPAGLIRRVPSIHPSLGTHLTS